jgi:hypothetical protein
MYVVSVYGSNKEWNCHVKKVNHKETKNGFKIENCWDKQIKKDKLLIPFSLIQDSTNFIERKIYCLDKKDIQMCITVCTQMVEQVMSEMLNNLTSMIDKNPHMFENISYKDYTKDLDKISLSIGQL